MFPDSIEQQYIEFTSQIKQERVRGAIEGIFFFSNITFKET